MATLNIVTGASGHLGSALVQALLDAGRPVRALVLPGDSTAGSLPPGVQQVAGDILDPASLASLLTTPDGHPPVVYHCAGIVSTASKPNPMLHAVNVEGTMNLLFACLARGVRRLVHVSSVHALPELPKGVEVRETAVFDPDQVVGQYAKSKSEATKKVLQAAGDGLDASVVFPTGLCGPGDRAMGHTTRLLMAFASRQIPMGVRGGFDFVDVRDVANGLIRCADHGRKGDCYILGNRFIPIEELFSLFSRFLGTRPLHFYAPMWLARLGLPLFACKDKLLRRKPLFNQYALYTLSGAIRYSHEKAKSQLGYVVRPFEDTIRDSVLWLENEGFLSKWREAHSLA